METDPLREAEPADPSLELGAHRSIADEDHLHPSLERDRGDGVDQHVEPLHRPVVGDASDHDVVGRRPEAAPSRLDLVRGWGLRDAHPVANDVQLRGIEILVIDRVSGDRLGVGDDGVGQPIRRVVEPAGHRPERRMKVVQVDAARSPRRRRR